MDLGDRRRRKRIMGSMEANTSRGGRPSSSTITLSTTGQGQVGHLVPAPLELRHELRREDPIARSHNLPELDVGRPQLLGRDAEPTGYPGHLLRAPAPPFGEVPQRECTTEVAHGGPHPGPRGQLSRAGSVRAAWPGARRGRGPGRDFQARFSRVENPGALVGEYAELGIGGGHDGVYRPLGSSTTVAQGRSGRRARPPAPDCGARAWPEPARRAT